MSDERNFQDGRQAKNLAEWQAELRKFKNKSLRLIQYNLGNCSNKKVCAEDVFNTALDKVSAKSIAEISDAESYFNTSAIRLAWRYPRNCLACSHKCTSLDAEENTFQEHSDKPENRRVRWNGKNVNYNLNAIPPAQKDAEEREQRLEILKILRESIPKLNSDERVLLGVMIDANFENKEILARLRRVTPISYVNMKTKKCRLLKKIKKIMSFFDEKRGKDE